jgi:hypothetical protein
MGSRCEFGSGFSWLLSFTPPECRPGKLLTLFLSDRNWGIAMFGGVAVICIVNYLVYARKFYKGPVVHVKSI